jgi:mono/diheme cytochrome c family protein
MVGWTVLAFLFLYSVALAGTNALVAVSDTLHGHFVYTRQCAVCHGRRGDGRGEMGLTLQPRPRDFTRGLFKYRSTPSGHLPTNDDLIRTIREGIPDTAMPIFGNLPARDVQAVVDYVKTFSPRWRQPENYAPPVSIPPRPSWFSDATALPGRAAQGRVFFETACASCHGTKGDGAGMVTNLVDSSGQPTPARDLRQPFIRSGRRPEDIYKALVTGLDGTPMPSFAESTTEEQRWELIAYIEQLRRDHAAQNTTFTTK